VDDDAIARLNANTAFTNLAVSRNRNPQVKASEERAGRAAQDSYRDVVRSLAGPTWMDRAEFLPALAKAARTKGVTIPTPIRNGIVKAVGVADPDAVVCLDSRGNAEPDPGLRDTETVPLTETVQAYFEREVSPHAPDAWIDTEYVDPTDSQVGRVGYEIPFNRFFYKYVPPRALGEIAGDIKALEADIVRLLSEVTA